MEEHAVFDLVLPVHLNCFILDVVRTELYLLGQIFLSMLLQKWQLTWTISLLSVQINMVVLLLWFLNLMFVSATLLDVERGFCKMLFLALKEKKKVFQLMTPSANVQLLLLRLYNLFRTVQQLHLQVTLFTPFADSFHYLKQLNIFQFHQLVTRLSGQKLKLHVENAIT